MRDFVVDRAITAGHDWMRTPALAVLASVTGYVRFNLRGRERLGMLDPGSETFARYVQWMRECFESFRIVETGESLVKDMILTRQAFPGPGQELPTGRGDFLDRRPRSWWLTATVKTV